MINPEQQAAFVEEMREVFLPIHGGWGRMGMTHIRLAAATEDVLTGALHTAWKLRVEKNAKSRPKRRSNKPALSAERKVAKPRRKTPSTPGRRKP